jgi:glycogen synthase
MLGWEYPPVKSGGLGTACYGLTKELAALGHDIIFVAPFAVTSEKSRHLNLVNLSKYKIRNSYSLKEQLVGRLKLTAAMKKHVTYEFIASLLNPYLTAEKYSRELQILARRLRRKKNLVKIFQTIHSCEITDNKNVPAVKQLYGADLMQEVYDYALKAEKVAAQ